MRPICPASRNPMKDQLRPASIDFHAPRPAEVFPRMSIDPPPT